MDYNEIISPTNNVMFAKIIYVDGKWIIIGYGQKGAVGNLFIFDGNYHLIVTEDFKKFDDKIIAHNIDEYDMNAHTINICYGNGIYAISIENRLLLSKDLKTFSEKNISFINNNFVNIYFVNNEFIGITQVSEYNNGILTARYSQIWKSVNCEQWTLVSSVNNYNIWDIEFTNNFYYISGTDGMIKRSTNLINWEECKSGLSGIVSNITAGTTGIVATGYNIENGKQIPYTIFSEDGKSFEKVYANPIESGSPSICYGNGIFMIMTSTYLLYSKDGKNYTLLIENSKYNFKSMVFSADKLNFAIVNIIPADMKSSIFLINISRDIAQRINNDEEIVYIYDLNFNFVGTIDSFKSLMWTRKYFEAGEFKLVVSASKDNVEFLQINRILIRNNYTEAAIIETVEYSDNGNDEDLTITGSFLSIILNRRIVKSTINFNGSCVDGMKKLINQMTPFPNFEIEQNSLSSSPIQFQCSYKNVYDYIVKLAKFSGIGFRIVANVENKVFIFENYEGKDRTSNQEENERYSFSDEEFNLDNPSLTVSNVGTINYCLVGGEGEGANRILVEVKDGNPTGFDLYESFVDANSSSQEGLSLSDYQNSLKQEGQNSFAPYICEFKFDVDASDYKDKFDLGDIVDCSSTKMNYYDSVRITEVEEVIEDGKKTVSLTLGTPIPGVWED